LQNIPIKSHDCNWRKAESIWMSGLFVAVLRF
jgi:hypothetical protein